MIEISARNLVETLRRLPLFTDLTENELVAISAHVTVHQVAAHKTIFAEGDPCNELFIVRDGRVNLLKTSSHGRQQLLSVERAGSSLSEISALDGSSYPATAYAVIETSLLRLEANHFRALCLQNPDIALKVIKVLGHRLRRMSTLIEDLSFSTVRGRLVAHLVHLARDKGQPASPEIEVDLIENNEQLAARLGTVRELVSRNLGRLHNEGLIHMSRRKVRIPSLDSLQDELVRNR